MIAACYFFEILHSNVLAWDIVAVIAATDALPPPPLAPKIQWDCYTYVSWLSLRSHKNNNKFLKLSVKRCVYFRLQFLFGKFPPKKRLELHALNVRFELSSCAKSNKRIRRSSSGSSMKQVNKKWKRETRIEICLSTKSSQIMVMV